MKNVCLIVLISSAFGVSAALPRIDKDEVAFTEDYGSRVVTVSYVLRDAPAIVTVDILTNGVSIGAGNFKTFSGPVNRLVKTLGERLTLTWKGYEEWPERKLANATAVVTAWPVDAPPDYRIVDLATGEERYYVSADAVPGGIGSDEYKTGKLALRRIHASGREFRAGAPKNEFGGSTYTAREVPHLVSFTNDWYIGVYPCTQKQYEIVMAGSSSSLSATPSKFKSAEDAAVRPVENVSYTVLRGTSADGYSWPVNGGAVDPERFFGRIRAATGVDTYDLPTDAQWEFSCRAGTATAFNTGLELTNETADVRLDTFAWYKGNSGTETHPVGLLKANNWGIYDMHGNVWEWVRDWYSTGDAYSDGSSVIDPPGAPSHSEGWRPLRGGAHASSAKVLRVAFRNYDGAGFTGSGIYGFRVMCGVKARME